MLRALTSDDLPRLFDAIAADFDLQVPVAVQGTRLLAPWPTGELCLIGPPLQPKPTAAFFPQSQPLLELLPDGEVRSPASPARPLALCGLDAGDLRGLAFLDRFFAAPPADDRYQGRRDGALLVGVTGFAGPDRAFLPLTAGGCDIELIATADGWLGRAHSARGEGYLEVLAEGEPEPLTALEKRSRTMTQARQEQLQAAAQLLVADLVPDAFWEEIAERCILCSGCNLSCPTCNCFCVQDRTRGATTERSRVWDSCQLDAFMREASGHNPLGTEALRTRRRIFHKLVADPQRWGEFGCVACGRCDAACPTGIGIFAVIEELLARYAGQSADNKKACRPGDDCAK